LQERLEIDEAFPLRALSIDQPISAPRALPSNVASLDDGNAAR
jgi:hypothetical protein